MQKTKKNESHLISITKINWEFIMDLNIKFKTIKFLEDNECDNLGGLEFGRGVFLDIIPKAWSMKEILISWASLKLEIPALQKRMSREQEDELPMEKIFAKHKPDKGLVSKMYEELLIVNTT